MSRREHTVHTIRLERSAGLPGYVPLFYFNGDRSDSDLVMVDVERHFLGEDDELSEWGFRWHRSDETMGQPESPVIIERADLDSYCGPDTSDMSRFEPGRHTISELGPDRYYVASLGLTGFTIMTFLRGFTRLLEDLYLDRDVAERIADIVFHTEEDLIRSIAREGSYDAVAFFDDWGTQAGMIISPEIWREFFKPRYRRQFALCHELGLDVYFHSCGRYVEIIPDLIEIGVDILNVSQPNVYDLPALASRFAGEVCFVIPVSYQTTSISGSCEDIRREVEEIVELFNTPKGGLIGYVEVYESIGLSDENYRCCVDAWRSIGKSR